MNKNKFDTFILNEKYKILLEEYNLVKSKYENCLNFIQTNPLIIDLENEPNLYEDYR